MSHNLTETPAWEDTILVPDDGDDLTAESVGNGSDGNALEGFLAVANRTRLFYTWLWQGVSFSPPSQITIGGTAGLFVGAPFVTGGTATLGGETTVNGDATFNRNVSIAAFFAFVCASPATFSNALTASGNTSFTGVVSASGSLNVTNGFGTDTLVCSGVSKFNGNATCNGALICNGALKANGGAVVVGGLAADSLNVAGGNSTLGTVNCTGAAAFASTVSCAGLLTCTGGLNLISAVTLQQPLTCSGAGTVAWRAVIGTTASQSYTPANNVSGAIGADDVYCPTTGGASIAYTVPATNAVAGMRIRFTTGDNAHALDINANGITLLALKNLTGNFVSCELTAFSVSGSIIWVVTSATSFDA